MIKEWNQLLPRTWRIDGNGGNLFFFLYILTEVADGPEEQI
jgi:hypothetical protein